ncbi:MAG: gamma-glutamylcyclotransferase [Schlesneria sp.]
MTDPSENQPASEVRTTRLIGGSVDSGWWRELPPSALEEVLVSINSSRQRKSGEDRLNVLGNAIAKIRNFLDQRPQSKSGHDESRIANVSDRAWLETAIASTDPEMFFDALFDQPSQRLAVYGSLKPGGSNAAQMTGIQGHWLEGTVHGIVEQPGEYLEFTWDESAPPVSVMVFSAPRLSEHFDRLDDFEGPNYLRTLVPVGIDGRIEICNVYEGKRRKKNHA